MTQHPILVIKQGAFGDLLFATAFFKKIRDSFTNPLILLTDPRYRVLTEKMPYFQGFYFDQRRASITDLWRLRRFLHHEKFMWVFDGQVTDRTNFYHRLFWPHSPCRWSGCAPGASHFMGPAFFHRVHVLDRFQKQLSLAGLVKDNEILTPDISWLHESVQSLPEPYVLFVPGSSQKHPQKRWPWTHYSALAQLLVEKGYHIGIIGGDDEKDLPFFSQASPNIHVLVGQLSFGQVAALARKASFVLGNDTGATHVMAFAGVPTYYCWSGHSDPKVFAPRGKHVTIFHHQHLCDLTPSSIWEYWRHEHRI